MIFLLRIRNNVFVYLFICEAIIFSNRIEIELTMCIIEFIFIYFAIDVLCNGNDRTSVEEHFHLLHLQNICIIGAYLINTENVYKK